MPDMVWCVHVESGAGVVCACRKWHHMKCIPHFLMSHRWLPLLAYIIHIMYHFCMLQFILANHFLNCPLKHYSSHVRFVIVCRRFTEQDQMHCMGTFLQGISAKIAHKYSFVVLYCQATYQFSCTFMHGMCTFMHGMSI